MAVHCGSGRAALVSFCYSGKAEGRPSRFGRRSPRSPTAPSEILAPVPQPLRTQSREVLMVARGRTPTHEHLRSRLIFLFGATVVLDAVASGPGLSLRTPCTRHRDHDMGRFPLLDEHTASDGLIPAAKPDLDAGARARRLPSGVRNIRRRDSRGLL
jgi:hypothetical protein